MVPVMTMVETPENGMREAILRPLVRFNDTVAGRPEDHRALAILLTDHGSGEIVGGLWGATMFSQLHIELLVVPEGSRRAGLGRRIMGEAEGEAIRRGCRGAWLDTFSFQARGFYEKLGYAVFGAIDDYPPGHSRFFLRKDLAPPSGSCEA